MSGWKRWAFLLAWPACGLAALSQESVVPSQRVRSVVRADARTGRLVRSVIVTPTVITPRAVSARVGGTTESPVESLADAAIPDLVEKTAQKYDVDPLLVHSVIQVESNYNALALSPKGAQGLMQLMPGTARRFGVRNTFDAKDNIEGGVRYLRFLTDLFPNDTRLAVAAYNAGEGAVWKYKNNIPPYRETEQYVYRVGQKYGKAKKAAERKKSAAKTASAPAPAPAEPHYAHVESFTDAQGRLSLRTNPDSPAAQSGTP